MKRPLVHIGMAKAASTFLQLELFPSLEGVTNLGKHLIPEDQKKSISAITRHISFNWRDKVNEIKTTFCDALDTARSNGDRPVLSDEDFSVTKFLDPETMARRLRHVLGDYDVLFIVREPFGWLASHYLFRLQHQNPVAVQGFEEWLDHHSGTQRIGSDITELWFAQIAEIYDEFCGGDVRILSYELLKQDTPRFADELAAAMCVSSDSVLKRLNTPPRQSAHKLRITNDKRHLFETFRWIEWHQPERFHSEVVRLSEETGNTLPEDFNEKVYNLGDVHSANRGQWAELLQSVAKKWPNSGRKPDFVFSKKHQNWISDLYQRNTLRLERNLGITMT